MKRTVWLPCVGAITWSALLLPGAIYVPIGFSQYTGPNANFAPSTRSTLVQSNGHGILILVAVPLLLSLLAGVSLIVQARTAWQLARWAAWISTGAVLAGAALGTVTFLIGICVMPAGALLALAGANVPSQPRLAPASPAAYNAAPGV